MADALTVAIVGVAGTVAVSLVTVAGAVTSARIQAKTAERNRDREDAVRADERRTEEQRRRQELEAAEQQARQQMQAEAERRRDEAAATAAEAQRQLNAERVAHQRDVAAAFVTHAQTLYRILSMSAKATATTRTDPDQRLWNELSERLGAVMLAFEDDHAQRAAAVMDTLQEVSDSLATRRNAPDIIARMLDEAIEDLRAFVAAARAIATS
jgi:flagellar biosynthesis GTPase FlhF